MMAANLTVPRIQGHTKGTELVTPKAIVPIGNKGFFMPDLQADYSTSVGSERNTTGIRPEYSRRLWTVTSSRRPLFGGRQPLVKVQTMNAPISSASRAPVTQSVQHANGTESTITWIKEPTVIKRIRRKLAERGGNTLVEFRPETGRTHQIRVHAEHGLGHALLGDPVYGNGQGAPRTMLHARALTVPREGKTPITAVAPLPADFRALGFGDDDLSA